MEHQQRKETEEKDENGNPKVEYETTKSVDTLNSMVPIWKRNKKDVTDEEYKSFYKEKFYDYAEPLRVIHQKAEGTTEYQALLYIPSHAEFNYYSKDFERGLQLYSSLDVATAIVRGAFEYQGQKCSAGSRAYIDRKSVV